MAGLAAFLAVTRPAGGTATIDAGETILLLVALGAGVLLCLGLALWRPGRTGSSALGVSGGLLYGASARIAKVATATFLEGSVLALLESWPLYAMAVLGPGGFVMTQHTYRAHRNLAPAQAVITPTDPLLGITPGVVWLHETIPAGPPALAEEGRGLATLATGVWLLARHAAAGSGETTENQSSAARAASF